MCSDPGQELIQKDIADRSAVMAERPSDISELELTRFLKGLPRRYLSVFGLATIYQHVRLARGLLPGELHASLERRDNIWELTVAALDKPFSNIAGCSSTRWTSIAAGDDDASTVLDISSFRRGSFSGEPRARRKLRACSRARGLDDGRRGAAWPPAERAAQAPPRSAPTSISQRALQIHGPRDRD
jgi:hypothetical protein